MNGPDLERPDRGLEAAKRLVEEREGIDRRPRGTARFVIPTIAIIWCLFQLSIASWWILDTLFIRAIHLGFAILIVFLNYPLLKKPRLGLRYLAAKERIPLLDYLIGAIAAFSAVYIAVDYAGITTRYGAPITRDIVIGLILVVLLLEATRRSIGPALPTIATFSAYTHFWAHTCRM